MAGSGGLVGVRSAGANACFHITQTLSTPSSSELSSASNNEVKLVEREREREREKVPGGNILLLT